MKWKIDCQLPLGIEALWKFSLDKRKKLKEFSDHAEPNKGRLHLDSLMKLEDQDSGSSFSIHIERGSR